MFQLEVNNDAVFVVCLDGLYLQIHKFSNGVLGTELPPFTPNYQVSIGISHSGNTLWWFSSNLKAFDVSDVSNMIELDSSSPSGSLYTRMQYNNFFSSMQTAWFQDPQTMKLLQKIS